MYKISKFRNVWDVYFSVCQNLDKNNTTSKRHIPNHKKYGLAERQALETLDILAQQDFYAIVGYSKQYDTLIICLSHSSHKGSYGIRFYLSYCDKNTFFITTSTYEISDSSMTGLKIVPIRKLLNNLKKAAI